MIGMLRKVIPESAQAIGLIDENEQAEIKSVEEVPETEDSDE